MLSKEEYTKLISKRFFRSPISTNTTSIKNFVQDYKAGEIEIPPWQRNNDAWKTDNQSLLIDSIMRGYHIPPFIVLPSKENLGIRYLDDGYQRLTSILSFIENKIPWKVRPYVISVNWGEDEEEKEDNNIVSNKNDALDVYYSKIPEDLKSEYILRDKTVVRVCTLSREDQIRFMGSSLTITTTTSSGLSDEEHKIQFERVQNGAKLNPAENMKKHFNNPVIRFTNTYIKTRNAEMKTPDLFTTDNPRCDDFRIIFTITEMLLMGDNTRRSEQIKLIYMKKMKRIETIKCETNEDKMIHQYSRIKGLMLGYDEKTEDIIITDEIKNFLYNQLDNMRYHYNKYYSRISMDKPNRLNNFYTKVGFCYHLVSLDKNAIIKDEILEILNSEKYLSTKTKSQPYYNVHMDIIKMQTKMHNY